MPEPARLLYQTGTGLEEKNKYFCFFRESCRDCGNFPFFSR
nr:MAG TPA: hypothetical protein [Caudoviricetes sp.]